MPNSEGSSPALHADATTRRDQLIAGALIVLSIVFSLVPTSFTMNEIGHETSHTITQGSAIRQIQFGSLFLVAIWLNLRYASSSLYALRRGVNPFLLITLLYCGASALWSSYPTISLKRTVLLAGLVAIGLAVSPPIGASRLLTRAMLIALTALVAVSAIVAVALPQIGVDYLLGNAWRGIMWQKNILGSIAGIALMLWLREFLEHPRWRRACAAGMLLSLFVLIMAKSTTALLVTAAGIAIYLALRRKWLHGQHSELMLGLGLALPAMIGLLVFYVNIGRFPGWQDVIGPITGALNKSADLTGRTDIWRLTLLAANEHMTLGIGYGGFWTGEGGPAQFIADQFGWMPSDAHNGYIDILNELGIVGSAIFGIALLWHASHLLRLLRIDRDDAALHCSIFVLILISNLSESQLLRDVSFQNILLFYSSITVSTTLARHRLQQRTDALTAHVRVGRQDTERTQRVLR